ncbi:hypothetical protein [Agathobaculum sp.]|uniref:hypothetical protein n=1 Tax=Agathobaculum sp. TaxID=2048138 RepID=UPI003AF03233
MDFSTEFVALRDRLLAAQDKAFRTEKNAELEGRMAAFSSAYTIKSARKILGLMPTGGVGHAHEYRLLFAVPQLDADGLADWWEYAQRTFAALVQPDDNHDFSIVSVILAAWEVDKEVPKRLKKLALEQQFSGGKQGWGSVRMAAVDLSGRKVHVSRTGDALKNIIKPLL